MAYVLAKCFPHRRLTPPKTLGTPAQLALLVVRRLVLYTIVAYGVGIGPVPSNRTVRADYAFAQSPLRVAHHWLA